MSSMKKSFYKTVSTSRIIISMDVLKNPVNKKIKWGWGSILFYICTSFKHINDDQHRSKERKQLHYVSYLNFHVTSDPWPRAQFYSSCPEWCHCFPFERGKKTSIIIILLYCLYNKVLFEICRKCLSKKTWFLFQTIIWMTVYM